MLTVSVLGYGYWGPNLVRNFHSLPASRAKFVCDLDVSRAALAENENPGVVGVVDAEVVFADEESDSTSSSR